ncbi:MAG: hypothetical protein ACI8UZ_001439 [Akkermansiaceae bacterium]|jgi:hypothetical protein
MGNPRPDRGGSGYRTQHLSAHRHDPQIHPYLLLDEKGAEPEIAVRLFGTSHTTEEKTAAQFGRILRGHWSVENLNHWKREATYSGPPGARIPSTHHAHLTERKKKRPASNKKRGRPEMMNSVLAKSFT